ncbi:MAG: DUF4402 domain-containing protein [Caulobacteraceae bacterium]|nr:MAG: DUF4402 domain-containing protein [Caulobacteraceae bacterium]
MTARLKIIALAALAAAVASPALAQSSATVTVNSTGRIISPMTLSKTADLAFGTIIKPNAGNGTVTIASGADTVAVTGTGTASMGTASRAKFTVGGEGGQTYSVTVPATMTMSNGSNNITVNLTPSATTGTLSGSLGGNGTQTFQVGGNFSLASTQATGAYAGSFNVTTAYN